MTDHKDPKKTSSACSEKWTKPAPKQTERSKENRQNLCSTDNKLSGWIQCSQARQCSSLFCI